MSYVSDNDEILEITSKYSCKTKISRWTIVFLSIFKRDIKIVTTMGINGFVFNLDGYVRISHFVFSYRNKSVYFEVFLALVKHQ